MLLEGLKTLWHASFLFLGVVCLPHKIVNCRAIRWKIRFLYLNYRKKLGVKVQLLCIEHYFRRKTGRHKSVSCLIYQNELFSVMFMGRKNVCTCVSMPSKYYYSTESLSTMSVAHTIWQTNRSGGPGSGTTFVLFASLSACSAVPDIHLDFLCFFFSYMYLPYTKSKDSECFIRIMRPV